MKINHYNLWYEIYFTPENTHKVAKLQHDLVIHTSETLLAPWYLVIVFSIFYFLLTNTLVYQNLPNCPFDEQLFQLQASPCTAKHVLIWGALKSCSDGLSSPSLEQHWNSTNQKQYQTTEKISILYSTFRWEAHVKTKKYNAEIPGTHLNQGGRWYLATTPGFSCNWCFWAWVENSL